MDRPVTPSPRPSSRSPSVSTSTSRSASPSVDERSSIISKGKSHDRLAAHPLLFGETTDSDGPLSDGTAASPLSFGLGRPASTRSSTSSSRAVPPPLPPRLASSSSASPPISTVPDAAQERPPLVAQSSSSYAVYKPRQRPVSTGSANAVTLGALSKSPTQTFTQPAQLHASTTSTSLAQANTISVPASPGSSTAGTASSKLQLQSLQATLQAAGLSHESLGWHIVQKLLAERNDKVSETAGWDIIYSALRTGKATLLLPKEVGTSSDVTPKLLRDHVILKDGTNLVTLSGVRGVKQDSTVFFASCVPGIDLKQTNVTEATLLELLGSASPTSTQSSEPALTFAVGKEIELNIPRSQASSSPARPSKAAAKPRTLASLFGGSRATAPAATSPSSSPSKSDAALALATAPVGDAALSTSSSATMSILAWPVDGVLVGKKLVKAVYQSIDSRTRSVLDGEDTKVAEMTINFLRRFHPPYKMLSSTSPITEEEFDKDSSSRSLLHAKIEDITTAMQEFFYDVHLRLEQAQQERAALAEALEDEELSEKAAKENAKQGGSTDNSLEKVEAFVCDMLYDKLFSPSSSADRSDDESLSTRIAGLHMLDLTLDHLGFQIEAPNSSPDWDDEKRILLEGLDDVVKQCGRELQRMQTVECRSPLAKLEVLVQVHKIIADSLEQLPAIPMKDDTSQERQGTATPSSRRGGQVYEMSDDAKSLGGRSNKQSSIRADGDLPTPLERTPRMPASRPSSMIVEPPLPSIKLPDAALQDDYRLPAASSTFVEDLSDPATASYFEIRSEASGAPMGTLKPKKASTTSADAILPLLIYSVVQANPSKLVSHTLFVQRFRADSLMRGEGEYCLCNLDAVKSFLMSCDIGSLGLGTDKILTTPDIPTAPLRMRHRTAQQLDQMVGSAGKVLGHAADFGLGGYRMLGGLLNRNAPTMEPQQQPKTLEEVQSVLAGGASKAASFKDSILRRGTVNSMTASPPKKETELADVTPAEEAAVPSISSRLASLPGLGRLGASTPPVEQERSTISGHVQAPRASLFSAFSLPLGQPEDVAAASARRSTISVYPANEQSPPPLQARERTTSFMSHSSHHDQLKYPPPVQRFLDCEADELRVGEVSLLLAEYKRMAAMLQERGVFGV